MKLPRGEYPRPQFVRESWMNLNGVWEFELDYTQSGEEKKYQELAHLSKTITVPFCPESRLSGIGVTDFIPCVWYKRSVTISEQLLGMELLLHFGASDYETRVFVNGTLAGTHFGGYTSFFFNITELVREGENDITVCVYDDLKSANQPAGKQCVQLKSVGCFYTRTTGIWQTVWLEAVEKKHIQSVNYVCASNLWSVSVLPKLSPAAIGSRLFVRILWEGREVGAASAEVTSCAMQLNIPLSEQHLWEPGQGNLYDVSLTLSDGDYTCDFVQSYFGLRTVGLDEKRFLINGKPVFGRWVLDQGFYPDGIYTAPTDEALKNDILYAMQLGFNGARLHEKVFEPRFLYWADRLGYLVWGEYANWGLRITEFSQLEHFLPEWMESVTRDMAHPSIIGWCPFNETWDWNPGRPDNRAPYHNGFPQNDNLIAYVYEVTKAMDATRPVIDTSGNYHVKTDIFDVHDYEQNPERFKEYYKDTSKGIILDQVERSTPGRQVYHGEPIFVSEYGGIRWTTQDGWGYGDAPKSEAEFIERYTKLTTTLLENPDIMGFCYTQLYDVEQEQNGLMTYDRKFKFDPEIFYRVNTQPAAIELLEQSSFAATAP